MKIKRKSGLIFFAAIFMLTLAYLVSAQLDLRYGGEQLVDLIQQFFEPFLYVLFGSYEYMFERFLFLLIVLSFSFVALKNFKVFEDHVGALWIVCIAVSILATRFLAETDVVSFVIFPYSVLGIALTSIIPLVIFFFFVQGFDSGVLRKIAWILFAVIFWGLWFSRYDDVGNLAWIYFLTGIIALIFLFADGTIRRILIKQQMEQLGIERREEFEREIRRQIRQADVDLNNNIITESQHRRIKRRLQKKLEAIRKN